ncbi:hypothetical protein [Ruminococcus bicirculans (ex Wegman et al. 2014)]|uniref:hypothetical protein n=1 Tax=Ruminococcus bicirculans (ex Wegman et al. 2014) TaxID=1160721 RepID=UPI0024310BE0|nr:hypothetical protein [Ruminococcus bicirculans (ex Wegman et al. 2014)]
MKKLCRKGNTIVAGFAASQNYYNVGSFAFIVKTLEKKLVYYFGVMFSFVSWLAFIVIPPLLFGVLR